MRWPRLSGSWPVQLWASRRTQPTEAAASGHRRVFTVDAGRPFLTVLAEALLAGDLSVPGGMPPDALELADITLYLPSRRPTRALQEAFLKASAGGALLLPRIKLIGEDSDELELIAAAEGAARADANMPRAIGELERRLVLTTLVLKWAEAERGGAAPDDEVLPYEPTAARTPAQAARLARELARLIDLLETERIDFERVRKLVPEEYSEHWSRTIAFLEIVMRFWPAHLAERNLLSPVEHHRRLLRAEVERLKAAPPAAPVIVAGVTQVDAAGKELIEAVLAQPNGALVLPTLDQTLDQESWSAISGHPEHPQFALKTLIDALGLSRGDIRPLGESKRAAVPGARWMLACEAMRPAGTTELWHRFATAADTTAMAAALTALNAVEAATAEEEAEAIALILREVADAPGRTAMLVTPDRALARRVSTRLAVWGLAVDDLAGEPFPRTAPGAFLELVAAAAQKEFEPIALMSLLKHPLCRLGMTVGELQSGRQALEVACFRSPYFGKGLEGLDAALERARTQPWRSAAVRRLGSEDWRAARDLVRRLDRAFRPMMGAFASARSESLATLAGLHYATAQALASTGAREDGGALRQGEAGEWATQFFAGLLGGDMPAPNMTGADYCDFYRTLVADKRIRPRGATHPRLSICDPFHARLQQADVVILGSLNEGTWPQAADPGPWLNRPMRRALGLPAPEERVGEAAHDFAAQLGAQRVILTRAAKVDGAPTVASRWLLRLQALVKGLGLSLDAEQPWLAWARARNAMDSRMQPVRAPEPRPPVAARPRQLSVTNIERWIASPYAVFARHVLRLEPLPTLGAPPGPALRGQIVHDALGRFAQRFPAELPRDIHRELMAIAREVLADYTSNPRVAAFWASRLGRFACWFAETEGARRSGIARVVAEASGKLVLPGPTGPFTLTARADRIDVGERGLVISDYKSSQSLDDLARRASEGDRPQLPLEAAIAVAGGFANVPAGRVAELRYISTSGGEPPGQDVPLKADDVAALTDTAREGLVRLIAEFDRETTPYRAVRRARFNYDYDEYAHLARVAEWSVDTGEED
jgi:ATP-dependent helicase/nuclease subunit B